jgi:hypothetical protein
MEDILLALAFFFLGWHIREIYAIYLTDKWLKSKKIELENNLMHIAIEDHQGEFYVYSKEDNKYLAHGTSKAIIENILNEKFPGKFFNASPEDIQKLKSK